MKVVYVSPNRSHHYRYAEALECAGVLHRFVSGFPRFSRFADTIKVPPGKIVRCDFWQILYILSRYLKLPKRLIEWFNVQSKLALDRAFSEAMKDADIGLFYNGTGLNTIRRFKGEGKIFICEAVNTHAHFQHRVLMEEAHRLGIDWELDDVREIPRRVAEYEESDWVLGPSCFVRDTFISEGIKGDKFILNPYGFTLNSKSSQGERRLDEAFVVLFVGQINFRKGIRYLVEAVDRLNHLNIKLRLVGPVSLPTGLEGVEMPVNVEFAGVLRGDDLQKAYSDADVFVQPSLEEGLSLVVGEAMASGLAVIATHETGAAEIIEDGVSGFLITSRDVDMLSERIKNLVENRGLCQSIGETARLKATGMAGWDQSGDMLVRHLSRIGTETVK